MKRTLRQHFQRGPQEFRPELSFHPRSHHRVQGIGHPIAAEKLPPFHLRAPAQEQEALSSPPPLPPRNAQGTAGRKRFCPGNQEAAGKKGGGADGARKDVVPLFEGDVLDPILDEKPHPYSLFRSGDHPRFQQAARRFLGGGVGRADERLLGALRGGEEIREPVGGGDRADPSRRCGRTDPVDFRVVPASASTLSVPTRLKLTPNFSTLPHTLAGTPEGISASPATRTAAIPFSARAPAIRSAIALPGFPFHTIGRTWSKSRPISYEGSPDQEKSDTATAGAPAAPGEPVTPCAKVLLER